MRTRTTDERVYETSTQQVYNASCVQTADLNYTNDFPNGTFRSFTDIVTPNFRKRVAAGEVIVNPMHSTVVETGTNYYDSERKNDSNSCQRSVHTNGFDIWEPIGTAGRVPYASSHLDVPLNVPALRAEAGTEASANVQSPDFEGLVFLGELRETFRLLRNPIGTLNKRFKRLREGIRAGNDSGKKRYTTLFDFLTENWLTYRYGISPLVREVRKAVDAVDALGDKHPRYTARGFARAEDDNVLNMSDTTGNWYYEATINTSRQVSVRAGILYETDRRSSFGVRLVDVPQAAWELIPFSFVADWFVNIGDYIGAITPKIGVRHLGSWTTVEDRHITVRTVTNSYTTTSGWSTISAPGGSTFRDWTSKKRHPGVRTGIVAKPTPFTGDFGAKRIIDSIALTNSLLRSRL